MHSARRIRRATLLVPTVVAAIAFTNGLVAQEPLRWKLSEGDTLRFRILDGMTLDTRGGETESASVTVQQEMNVSWTVERVEANGDARIRQKIDEVKFKLSRPDGERIEYDSESEDESGNLAAMVAPIYDALTADALTFTMEGRGAIKDVKASDKVIRALKGSPHSAGLGAAATPEGLQRVIMKWAPVLPEESPAAGQEWSTSVEFDSPHGGKQKIESTFLYKGMKEVDGKTYAVIEPGLELTIADIEKASSQVVEQDSGGEILFDPAAGRIYSAQIERSVTMDVTVAEQTAQQKVKQTVEVEEVE